MAGGKGVSTWPEAVRTWPKAVHLVRGRAHLSHGSCGVLYLCLSHGSCGVLYLCCFNYSIQYGGWMAGGKGVSTWSEAVRT